ncbi:MAG: SBBP repeat-containing protein, partial [Candidatus Heimdallarchaeota archaeon]
MVLSFGVLTLVEKVGMNLMVLQYPITDSDGSLIWSSYIGGESWDESHGITVSDNGFFYVTGFTTSSNFPILDAFASERGSNGDAFVAKFTTDCSLLWSTFLGGNGLERGFAVATNSDGCCYVTGETFSTDFPTEKPFEDSVQGIYDAFITKFTTTGSLIWSTYLGGSRTDSGKDIVVTKDNRCFVVGITYSVDFPETQNAFDRFYGGATDAFITALIEPPTQQTIPSYYFYGFLVLLIIELVSVIILYRRKI